MRTLKSASKTKSEVVLEFEVDNHPGVMSHLIGLFTRRACNVEQVVCFPLKSGATSRVWFLINQQEKASQMVKLALGLEDVISVRFSEKHLNSFRQLPDVFA